MLSLSDYQILAQLYESPNSLVYRAVRNDDQQPVILKQLKADYLTPAVLARYHHEFEILSLLKLPGVIRAYELRPYQNTLLLVVEDFGGDSLKVLTQQRRWTLAELLPVFIQAADSLGQVHAADLIHKDLNPNNIVCNLTTDQLKFIDFGIASRLPRENPTLKNPNQLEGTLPYLSPEQTGRMNRSLDYRTDFYSLGVTFYELLTGQLPFVAEDAMEMVHCHLAKPPLPPHQVNPLLPPVLSDLVLKLMAKTAEDRYQSAFGLKSDLEHLLANLTGLTDLSGFKLAQHDFSTHFHLPQKLYGREAEIQQILAAFDTVVQGHSQLLLVAGYSGIGKSVLVREVYKPITEKRGYFITGKFDQFQRNVPYSAVAQAFRDLVHQRLTETQSRLDEWQTQILTAVGNNGQVLIELIPEMALIFGPQPAVPTLPPTESQNRFNLVFQNFVKVFGQVDHPLVIFLDDLQWVDSASLKLLTLLMNDIPYLLVIGAYRDNEVSPVHPLMTTLEDLQKQGRLVQTLTLTPLTLSHLNQLVSDTLHLPTTQTLPLAELVLEKTGGNPFFMGEFLKTLYVEHWLEFNANQRVWQWDLAQIKARNITANVVELMTGKIQGLPSPTQAILKLAASVGNQFDLATLAVISQTSVDSVKTDLWEALREGLVVPLEENYKFVHDRIQQAAYSLIPETDRPALHWQIGQLLKNHLSETLGERLFEVVDHLNQGSSLATTPEEKIQLIQLNLQAAQKAKFATAYRMVISYLHHSYHWLTPTHWQTDYDLALSYHLELSEARYLGGDFDQMETVADIVLQQARTPMDTVKVYEILVQAYTGQTQYLKAIQTARKGLSLFGVELPEKPTPADLASAWASTASRWQGVTISELVHLPRLTSTHGQATMRLLSSSVAPSYVGMPELFPLIVSNMVNLSIEQGHAEQSPVAYSVYGSFLCATMEIEAGYQFGQLALQVLERLDTRSNRSRTLEVVKGLINPWKEPLSVLGHQLKEVYQITIEEGDFECAGYTAVVLGACTYFSGQSLEELELRLAFYLQELMRVQQNTSVNYLSVYRQSILTLRQTVLSRPVTDLSEESTRLLRVLQAANDYYGLFQFYSNRLSLCYLFYDYRQALENAHLAHNYLAGGVGSVTAFFHFYDSLSRLAVYSEAEAAKCEEILQSVSTNQAKMKQWAQHAPMNYQHKYDLVEAEKARVWGQFELAAKGYEKAIAGARENEYLQEEALAYELAARFYLSQGMEKFAQSYLQEASHCYQRWGALAKVQHLQMQYPQLLAKKSSVMPPNFLHTRMATTSVFSVASQSTGTQELDVNSILKSSQILSEEIVLPRLLEKMMLIVIENAGAELGLLLLPKSNQWFIEAEGQVGQTNVTVLQAISIDDNRRVSAAMIAYVIRTQQPLVLDAASQSGQFTRDPHIVQSQVKSVLVVPLKHQGVLTGIVYLENNLTTGAFTADRLEVLNLISSQLAISIENALLYVNLEQKVAERTQELSEALAHLKTTQTHLIEVEKMAALGNLVAGVAHEINTPVGIGVTAATQLDKITVDFANLYKSGKMSRPDLEQYLNATYQTSALILKNLTRAAELTQSFKQVAVDQTSEQQRTFVLQEYINEILVSLRPKLKNTGYQVSVHCEETIKCTTYPGALAQILTNLIMNSLQHGFQGRATGQITITAIAQAPQVILHYRDDGNGIAPDVINKIFEPFFTTNRQGGGTGLGLHIVYNLVTHKLNGTIRCHSELGKGVDFTLILPMV